MDDDIENEIVRINVGGSVFECYKNTLERYPGTRLAKLEPTAETFNSTTNEHFFDRDSVLFRYILNAYRTGELHLPKDACSSSIHRELEYWGLSVKDTAVCCWKSLYKSDNEVKTIHQLVDNYKKNTNIYMVLNTGNTTKKRLWLFLDDPRSSTSAMVWAVFMATVVTLSSVISALESVPELRVSTYKENEMESIRHIIRHLQIMSGIQNTTDARLEMFTMRFHPALTFIDAIFFVFISAEVILRLICCPDIRVYVKSCIHIVEIITIFVFWTSFSLEQLLAHLDHEMLIVYICVKTLTALKLFRLFRIVKIFPAFDILSLSVTTSKSEIGILLCLLLLLTFFFGYFMFCSEIWFNTNFPSAFAAMYWSLITLTTVGYGDYYPETVQGCIVACACSVCGVMILALPIGIIASNFHSLYAHHKYAYKHITAHRRNAEMVLAGTYTGNGIKNSE